MFTSIITTMDVYDEDNFTDGGLIDVAKQRGTLKEYQKVVAIGGSVREIKVGDLVSINPTRFAVKKHKEGSLKDGVISDNPVIDYHFDVVEMNDKKHLLLQDRDINFIIEEYEEVEESKLIKSEKKKIIV